MSSKNKWAIVFTLLMVVALLLSACGGTEPEPTQPAEETTTEESADTTEAEEPATEEPAATVEEEEPATEEPAATTEAEEPTEEAPAAEEGQSEIKNPDTFIQLTAADVISLDPAWIFDGGSYQVETKIYEKLIAFRPDSVTEFEPILASEVPSEENGLITSNEDGSVTIAFPIREGVTFHNGETLTPEDVKYSFMRFLLQDRSGGGAYVFMPALTGGPSHISELAVSLAGAEEFEEVDDAGLVATYDFLDKAITINGNTVEFHLPAPYAPFMSVLAGSWPDRIVNKEWVVNNGGWPGTAETWNDYYDPAEADSPLYEQANGTGPFKLVRWDRTNQEVTLERFDDYWRGPAKLENIAIRHVPEWATRRLILEAGDADFIDADYTALEQLEGSEGIAVQKGLPTLRNRVLHFNWNVPAENAPNLGSGQLDGAGIPADFFSDENVRKGFAYAFDYDTYISDVWNNEARQSTGPILEGQLGLDESQPAYVLDLAKAEEHFRNAYDGQLWENGFTFTATTTDRYGEIGTAALEILAEGLRTVNPKFNMEVETVQWSNFLGRVFGEQDMPLFLLNAGADFADTDNMVSIYMGSNYLIVPFQGDAFVSLAEQEFDPLIDEARSILNEEERASIYDTLQRMAYDNAIDLFLEQGVESLVTRDWVQGLTWNPADNSVVLSFWDVAKSYE